MTVEKKTTKSQNERTVSWCCFLTKRFNKMDPVMGKEEQYLCPDYFLIHGVRTKC